MACEVEAGADTTLNVSARPHALPQSAPGQKDSATARFAHQSNVVADALDLPGEPATRVGLAQLHEVTDGEI